MRQKRKNLLLVDAVYSGNYEYAKMLLHEGADVNYVVECPKFCQGMYLNRNAMSCAVQNNNVQMIWLLLKHGYDVNQKLYRQGKGFDYPIVVYALRRRAALVNDGIFSILIQAGADVNATYEMSKGVELCPLFTSIMQDRAFVSILLYAAGAKWSYAVSSTVSMHKNTRELYVAMIAENMQFVRLILRRICNMLPDLKLKLQVLLLCLSKNNMSMHLDGWKMIVQNLFSSYVTVQDQVVYARHSQLAICSSGILNQCQRIAQDAVGNTSSSPMKEIENVSATRARSG